ncbi:hypothetical protein [Thalassobellus suaedae]|uniref:Uncharacterized protein n=1 Tax=Thalassobellus suaedae TaxID=3074124 RepID=A0ABY9XVQ7_9FLAO|nr:hypothetical protein RHP51_04910 [Flavobacteriaceae bacterium HL-DH14]
MEQNIYRLTGGDYSQSRGVQLPIKGQFIEKIVTDNNKKLSKGLKRIVYIKGSDSIFIEDQKGDLQPQTVWFKFGDLNVDKNDTILNKIVQNHKWFKSGKIVLWSQENEDHQKLANLRFKGEARKLIDDSPLEKIRAIALAVFGYQAITWNDEKCELELRDKADEDPKSLKEAMEDKDYNSKLIAGQAFAYIIVKENASKTAVVWSDSEGEIIKLAKGEKGITELGRFLSKRTEESVKVLQSIGDRVDAKLTSTDTTNSDDVIDAKDREIAALKAQLEKQSGGETENEELAEATKTYETLFEKAVAHNMKNNLEWIKGKIAEKEGNS